METLKIACDADALREFAKQIRHLPSNPFYNPPGDGSGEARREEMAVQLLLDAIQFGAFRDPCFRQLCHLIEPRADQPRSWRTTFREASVWLYQHPYLLQRTKDGLALSSNVLDPDCSYGRLATAVEASADWWEARLGPGHGKGTSTAGVTLTTAARLDSLITKDKLETAKSRINRAALSGAIHAWGLGRARRFAADGVVRFLLRQSGIDVGDEADAKTC